MKVLILSFLSLTTQLATSQKCSRPDEVYVFINHSIGDLSNQTLFYENETNEKFKIISDIELINEYDLNDQKIYSTQELRELEQEIRKCEIENRTSTIHLDININAIFHNIFMILRVDNKIYRCRVSWIDSIE